MKSEKQTRKDIINERLRKAGWILSDRTQVIEEFDIEIEISSGLLKASSPNAKHQFSDYVLLGKDGKPIAVVEAKKSAVDASKGREQAKQYCYNIQEQHGGELPFCFYTNGYDIYFWDLENYPPRKVYGFPTREDLERYSYLRRARKPLASESINTKIAGREYQIASIRAVMEAIEKKRKKFLLVMATGTGKTRTCVALVDALMRFGWVERTLFLVDRIALRKQTVDAFKEYLPNEPSWPKEGEHEISADRRIYVSTYPTMLNIIRDESQILSPHFFDLVVVDESHRSIYNTYQEILDYFNTITLGLTATPTDVIDHNTFQLFECEDGVPTFAYSYEEAVNHIPPYLCNFQVMKIKSKFQTEGISKRTISLEDQRKLILEGKEVAEINFEGTDLEKTVINKGTNSLIVREFMEECIKDPNGVLPGKTIFFCMTKAHARRIEEIFDSLYPEYKGEIAKVLVSDDPRVQGTGGLLDQFTKKDMPRIAISVDMLDTGIDVREIVNLVFAKPVYSYTKFWQMIGRGTRLLEQDKIKPWCPEKSSFLVLDCWDNFEYFKLNPKGKTGAPQIPLPVRLFGLRLDKITKAIELDESSILKKEIYNLQNQISTLPKSSVVIIEAQNELQSLENENFWNHLNREKIEFLHSIVKPLFRAVSGVDFKAMRFEKDIVEASLTFLSGEKDKFETLKSSIVETIGELPLSVNTVAREENLIRTSQTNQFWSTINEEKFDLLIHRLSPLMKQIEKVPILGPTKFDLKDIVIEKEFVEFGPSHEALSVARYRELVEVKVNELVSKSPILKKIKQGQEISNEETEILAEELYNEHPHITIDLLRRVYNHRKAELVQFIKHILGIEILESFSETVSKAFEIFIQNHSYLTSRQLQFMDLLKSYILEKGELYKRNLIESPFTLLHPDGIRGIFGPREIDEILELADKVIAA
ncbi:type I restriction endonuclease subunit R [Leptospira borgpetersenii]|uniref:Type III restriction enzyme, res subunit n=3 Tax=Leptospira borgpetersenii TaxID=174 RepID=A0A0E3B3N7_LEPBO|nr:DEAD/DEAH box helicase family protein [Leptospira borgpetersenii]EMO08844.1 type III restriction enzyme, res subunit [Leptospira borgpetersenii str. Noumea 25]EMO62393.1 type III restriction enzyme, res subunit [Leptospira borgpetersenii serovar Pomona str. 200901868]ALO26003.1 type III restriction enzyme, res subunit [Leptospira borgpetersenii serovar Ballum]ANH00771.2 Type III restriction enzyme, res subunit [Leptospira borgpetersenii str. 4E]EKR01763.1 type III restriction enzyme, res su